MDTLDPPSCRPRRLARVRSAPAGGRDLERILADFDAVADRSPHCLSRAANSFTVAGQTHRLPRYVYLGPGGNGEPLRLAVFAGIHGDEPAGTLALLRLARDLERLPTLAHGYALFLYPACNPTGLVAGTRHNHRGLDLNREFWWGSVQPEVRLLESELWMHAFHGLITLHSDDTSPGVYGYVKGARPPSTCWNRPSRQQKRSCRGTASPSLTGWPAQRGIIQEGFEGVWTSPGHPSSPPFEVTLETPAHAPEEAQVAALNAAVQAILTRYREFMSYATNL